MFQGLLLICPAFVFVGFAYNEIILYVGVFLFAVCKYCFPDRTNRPIFHKEYCPVSKKYFVGGFVKCFG